MEAIRIIYRHSDGKSFRRLNAALYATLNACIEAGMKFELNTFDQVYAKFKGSYWMGNSHGSRCGESLYGMAIKFNNMAACLSFEDWQQTPPVLWDDDDDTPKRHAVGDIIRIGRDCWRITDIRQDKVLMIHNYGSHGDGRRKQFTHAELAAMRRDRKKRLKAVLGNIRSIHASTGDEVEKRASLETVWAAIRQDYENDLWQHYEIEEIRAATRVTTIAEERRTGVTLEISGSRVLASNGQSAPLRAVQAVLPAIMLALDGQKTKFPHTLDGHGVFLKSGGLQVGCTFVPTAEIRRIAPLIISAA